MINRNRREFLQHSLAASAALGLGPAYWSPVFADTVLGDSPYGPLGNPDANGVRLPKDFSARLIAKTGEVVAGTGYIWPGEPDGSATFPRPNGGWVLACNSELNGTQGGASAIRFAKNGTIEGAYRILAGTKWNCSGGATPWSTWLSCEEHRAGLVWECDPFAAGQGIARPAMGKFPHEAAVVDPATGFVYMTEDDGLGRLYRFRPVVRGKLGAGTLEAAAVDPQGYVTWVTVPPDRPYRGADTTAFTRGEGAWFANGHVYFCTTADNRVWALEVASGHLETIYDAAVLGTNAPLHKPDNVTVHPRSGDIFVCEDGDDLQIVLLADQSGDRIVAPFAQLIGHAGSEVTGPAFSPDGTRLYFSSQRGTDGPGMTFEVKGPFRR